MGAGKKIGVYVLDVSSWMAMMEVVEWLGYDLHVLFLSA